MIGISTVLLWGLWLGSIAGVVSWMIALMRDRRSATHQKVAAQMVITDPTSHPVGIRTPPPVPPSSHDGLDNQL
ncbi:MAG TPA: hypothetical protein V6C64_07410 [Microcoleaceae cyanobacterium]|jgi:hypothetical protein